MNVITSLVSMQAPSKIKSALSIFAFLLFSSFIHPFRFDPYTTYFHDILTILGLLTLLSYMATDNVPRLIFPKLIFFPLTIILVIIIQIALKIAFWPVDLVIPILYFMLIGLAFVIGASLAAQTEGAEGICQALAVAFLSAALLSVVMQIIQAAHINAMPFVMPIASGTQPFLRPYANIGQPNQLALLQCIAVASVWWLYQKLRLGLRTSIAAVLFLIFGLSLTQSRIGWIILPIFAMTSMRDVKDERSINGLVSLFFVGFYLALILGLPSIGRLIGFTIGSPEDHIGGRSERWVLMQQAWYMILEHPWLGVGWFGFGAEQVKIATAFSAATYAEHSHNLILNFAAELGIPATILGFSGLSWWFVQCCLLPKTTIISRFSNLLFIAVFVHSMVEFPLWYAYFLIPVSMLMGMMHQLRWPSQGVLVRPSIIFTVFLFAGSILVAVTLSFQRVTLAYDTIHLNSAGYNVDMTLANKPTFTLFPQFYDELVFASSTVYEHMPVHDIEFAERVSHRFAYPHILNKLANIYALNDRPQKAVQTLVTLQRLHPTSYPKYYDEWRAAAATDARYSIIVKSLPKPGTP